MDKVLKVIDSLTSDVLVKSIINSLNDNQEASKKWLIDKSKNYIKAIQDPKILVLAGWYGNLASKLSNFSYQKPLSVDIDNNCRKIGRRLYEDVEFKTADVLRSGFRNNYLKKHNVIVCTSCEHFDAKDFKRMFNDIKKGSLVIFQSNNYFKIKEHVNCFYSYHDFAESLKFNLLWKGKLKLDKFTRFMAIGIK